MARPGPGRGGHRDAGRHRRLLRVKLALASRPSAAARSAITATENAITAFSNGRAPASRTGRAIVAAWDAGLQLTGNPVADWQLARARLRGSAQLDEMFAKARLLRLLHATDALAWGLSDSWDGQGAYPGAADTVRRILADEIVTGRPAEPHPVTVMNMHKSKGKEFDAVVIVEGQYHGRLLDQSWDAGRITRQRRVIRVAITRARHAVAFVRPRDAISLTPMPWQ